MMIEYTVKVHSDGSKYWYRNHLLHREDGSAVEYADGTKLWYLNGEAFTEKGYREKMNPAPCAGKIVEIDGVKYRLTPA